MGFIILIFQSIFKFNFIKASIAFTVFEAIWVLSASERLEVGIVKLVLFVIFSFLIDRFQDSIFKWLVVLLSAGLILS